ncbi:MAG: ketopantoate reductase family protein [Oscillospiraceae bacterium]|jgi:2-dehydropantoate 2-reductase|nr:ketopantoate reductase family protein [Oscillospiraceae bacterium]
MTLHTLLVGPGAIGGTVATFAAEKGFAFDVLGRPEEAAFLAENDYEISGVLGEHRARLRVFGGIDELPEAYYDVVLIATKAQSMPFVAQSLLPRLREDSLVLGLQNGITTELMAEVVGAQRTVSCMIGIGATAQGIGRVELTSGGHFIIGQADVQNAALGTGGSLGSPTKPIAGTAIADKLEYLRSFIDAMQPTKISENILGELYSKLVFNACINALCALSGMTLGVLLDDKKARQTFLAIAREGMAVADKIGLDVPPFMGLLDYRLIAKHTGAVANALFGKLFQIIGKVRIGKVHPSTLQSLERGEITEIDYLNGYFLKRGDEVGVACPVNAQIIAMIHEIERGERQMGLANIAELVL